MDNLEKARILQVECEMWGMIAENKQREHLGQSMAYIEYSFQVLVNRLQKIIDDEIKRYKSQ